MSASTSYSSLPDEGDSDEDLYKYSMTRKVKDLPYTLPNMAGDGDVTMHSASYDV